MVPIVMQRFRIVYFQKLHYFCALNIYHVTCVATLVRILPVPRCLSWDQWRYGAISRRTPPPPTGTYLWPPQDGSRRRHADPPRPTTGRYPASNPPSVRRSSPPRTPRYFSDIYSNPDGVRSAAFEDAMMVSEAHLSFRRWEGDAPEVSARTC